MVKELNAGQMEPNIQEDTYKVKNKEMEISRGQMEVDTSELLKITILKEKANILGLMGEFIQDIG